MELSTTLIHQMPVFNTPPMKMHAPPLGSVYNKYKTIVSTTNPNKVINKYGLFYFEEDLNATPWHIPCPSYFPTATTHLPKFKYYLPKFSSNGIFTVEENLNDFYNTFITLHFITMTNDHQN